ncbi:uncharacterized protein LOC131213570 [Anopheles bellator]|uniref:uncharacterized protein LOC131213570 n=1 Tax=Anopheles bellator TaxID=139047 RepID=UPI002648610C|nr:uncharacterized protein LOC131213570 [Anopheles bellator]
MMYDQETDDRGYFVYKNRYNGKQEQDNPNLLLTLRTINEKHAASRYSTYRCASKLYDLQKALNTSTIPFEMVCSILKHHQLNLIDSAPSVKPAQLTAAIHDIFYAANQVGRFEELSSVPNTETAIALLVSFFWAVFDPRRTTPISVLELHQTFLLLCDHVTVQEMIWHNFLLTSDHNLCVSRHRFEIMLGVLSKILAFIGEPDHLRPTMVQQITNECFANYPGTIGLNEYQFSCLWKLSSLFSYYANVVSLGRRLRESENVFHGIQCTACHFPIRGLRFQCQRCLGVSLCIECFTAGYTNKRHVMTHKIFEISSAERNERSRCGVWFTLIGQWLASKEKVLREPNPSTFDTIGSKLIDTKSVELIESTEQSEDKVGATETILPGNSVSRVVSSTLTRNLSGFSADECADFSNVKQKQLLTKLMSVTNAMEEQSEHYTKLITELRKELTVDEQQRTAGIYACIDDYVRSLADNLVQLKRINAQMKGRIPPSCSTPYRHGGSNGTVVRLCELGNATETETRKSKRVNTKLSRTEFSIRDISTWFHIDQPMASNEREKTPCTAASNETSSVDGNQTVVINRPVDELPRCTGRQKIDTDLVNFRDLLLNVREIIDDLYSDNAELAHTTQQIEIALDRIIADEELKQTNYDDHD